MKKILHTYSIHLALAVLFCGFLSVPMAAFAQYIDGEYITGEYLDGGGISGEYIGGGNSGGEYLSGEYIDGPSNLGGEYIGGEYIGGEYIASPQALDGEYIDQQDRAGYGMNCAYCGSSPNLRSTSYGRPSSGAYSSGGYGVSAYGGYPSTISPRPSLPYSYGGSYGYPNTASANITNTSVNNTSIENVDNSIRNSFNNYNSNNETVIALPVSQYTAAVSVPLYAPPAPHYPVINQPTYAYAAPASYVALSQIPYTGFELPPYITPLVLVLLALAGILLLNAVYPSITRPIVNPFKSFIRDIYRAWMLE